MTDLERPAPPVVPLGAEGARRRRPPSTYGWTAAVVALVCGAGLVLSAVVAAAYGEASGVGLAVCGLASAIAGALGRRRYQLADRVRAGTLLVAVAVAWIVMIAVGTVAYLAAGALGRVDDAVFESVSGFTTTGLTVVVPEEADRGVLAWRALTQWIGAFGAVTVAVAVLPYLGGGGLGLDRSASGRLGPTVTPRIVAGVGRLAVIYGTLTSVVAAGYLAGGMGPFDAVTYALTTASTGGFANHEGSIGVFDSVIVEWTAVVGMAVAGASFALWWHGFRRQRGSFLRSVELRVYLGLVVVASVTSILWTAGTVSGGTGTREAALTAVSVLSTTGYSVVDWGTWPLGAQVVLLVLMGVGSMSGSAGGGFKVLRVLALIAYLRRELVRQLHPRSVTAVKVGGEALPEPLLARMVGYQVLYLLVAAGATIAVAATGTELITAMSTGISALSTVGPALGALDPSGGALSLEPAARAVTMVVMLAGRLEIYPVLALGAAAASGTARARSRRARAER